MKAIFAFALIQTMFGQERHLLHDNHHSPVEVGVGVRMDHGHFFFEPTIEVVGKRIRPSFDAGVLFHDFEFLSGMGPFRAGVRLPVYRHVKLAVVAEKQWILGGAVVSMGKSAELDVLANTQVVKATLLFKIHHHHKKHH